MSALFSPIALRGLALPNRIVVSPMCQYSAADGSVGDWHLMHLGSFAVSGFALVMTEATAVEPRGRITPGCAGLYSDANERALARVVEFCRRSGPAKIGIQLAHAGRKASCRVPWQGGRPLAPGDGGWTTCAPSAVPFDEGYPVPEPLDRRGMAAVIEAFVQAAGRADRIGFDAIEIHGAHGYLLHEFLSPLANRRNDDYGGPRESRMRFPLEVVGAVRRVWPAAKPLGLRISAEDYVAGGWAIEDSIAFARELKALGCDFLDVSGGGVSPKQVVPAKPCYQVPASARIRKESGVATIAVGMITTPEQGERIVADGQADLVALGRGALYDPRWPWHAAEALGARAAYPEQYLRCRPQARPEAFVAEAPAGRP